VLAILDIGQVLAKLFIGQLLAIPDIGQVLAKLFIG
jgi:hypothetical protein